MGGWTDRQAGRWTDVQIDLDRKRREEENDRRQNEENFPHSCAAVYQLASLRLVTSFWQWQFNVRLRARCLGATEIIYSAH
jgi:hypothetical protein